MEELDLFSRLGSVCLLYVSNFLLLFLSFVAINQSVNIGYEKDRKVAVFQLLSMTKSIIGKHRGKKFLNSPLKWSPRPRLVEFCIHLRANLVILCVKRKIFILSDVLRQLVCSMAYSFLWNSWKWNQSVLKASSSKGLTYMFSLALYHAFRFMSLIQMTTAPLLQK